MIDYHPLTHPPPTATTLDSQFLCVLGKTKTTSLLLGLDHHHYRGMR